MDMQKTAREIGLFESAVNLSGVSASADVVQKLGGSMPLPDKGIKDRVCSIAKWLLGFNKKKYMFLMPEIAIVEEMSRQESKAVEAIIAIPCDLNPESKERLKNNLPHDIEVTILEEPYFPEAFFPGNSVMVISGYSGGDRAMVLHDTYRMVEHYSGFLGKKVFIPYVELKMSDRYDGWMEMGQQRINEKWRAEL